MKKGYKLTAIELKTDFEWSIRQKITTKLSLE